MLKVEKLLNEAIKNEASKEVKAYNLLKALKVDEVEKVINDKNYIEYVAPLKNDYSIKYQVNRDEIILYYKNTRVCEIYTKGKAYNVWTRGNYLLKIVFKNNKKDEALKGILRETKAYNPKCDMKHSFKNITLSIVDGFINKLMRLDYNLTLTSNDLVEEGEDLDSIKTIYLKKVEDEEEEA